MATKLLTDRLVTAAKAPDGGGRSELWDSKVPGLCLRVSKEAKVWLYRYRTPDGRQPRYKLGDYSAKYGLADAREEAEELRVKIRRGFDPAAAKKHQAAAARAQVIRTMADLSTAYFAACESGEWQPRRKRKKVSTLAEERGVWRRHLGPALDGLRVEDVGADEVKRILRGIVAAGHQTTANRTRSLIRQVFNYAVSEGRAAKNPVLELQGAGVETGRERVLTDAELKALWGALSDPSALRLPPAEGEAEGKRVYASEALCIAIKLCLLLAPRRSEVAGCRLDELDFAASVWAIRPERTKSGRGHVIPLTPLAVALIERAQAIAQGRRNWVSPFLFPGHRDRERPVTPEALSHTLANIAKSIGADDIRLHDLRRTASTLMASRLELPPFIIGQVLSHSTERGGAAAVTGIYNRHKYVPQKRAALEAWGILLAAIVGDAPPRSNVHQLRA